MQPSAQAKVAKAPFSSRRSRIYLLLLSFALIGVILFNIHIAMSTTVHFSTLTNNRQFIAPSPQTHEAFALGDCVVPDSYAPLGPGACVLSADGTMQVVPGNLSNDTSAWNEGECEATLHRLAPWLRPVRADLAAAPPLRCGTRGYDNYTKAPLFTVQKMSNRYVLTEPQWASAMTPETEFSEEDHTPEACPDTYFTSHTHGFGQTFNQIQSIISALWLSKVFNRTFVFPLLAVRDGAEPLDVADTEGKLRTDFERYFSVEKLRRAGYCIVNYSTFEADMRRRFPEENQRRMIYYESLGNTFYRTLFRDGFVDTAPLLSPPNGTMPERLRFRSTFGRLITVLPNGDAPPGPLPSEQLVMLQNSIGFFVRAPFKDYIHILGHLEPSVAVAAKLDEELQRHAGKHTIAFHLRNREGICQHEQNDYHRYMWPPNDRSPHGFQRSEEGKQSVMQECPYTAERTIQRIHLALSDILPYSSSASATINRKDIKPSDVSIFLAADNERPEEMEKLGNASMLEGFAVYRAGEIGNATTASLTDFEKRVFGVVFDYFMFIRADVFFGNRLSSISQCACLARLGQRRACHGVPTGHLRALFHPDVVHVLHR